MKKLIVLGVLLIVAVELLTLAVRDHRLVLAASGVAVALVLLNIRRVVGHAMGRRRRRTPMTWATDCVAGCRVPRPRSVGRNPPGRTGTGICVRCWRDDTKSRPGSGKPKIRRHFTPPGACCSGRTCGSGSIRTMSRAPGIARPVPVVRPSKRYCSGWSRCDRPLASGVEAGADVSRT